MIYVLVAPRVFRVKTILLPPADDDISQNQLMRLEQMQITADTLHTNRLDGDIAKALSPLKSRKTLLLVLGGILGLCLGLFAVHNVEFIAKARE